MAQAAQHSVLARSGGLRRQGAPRPNATRVLVVANQKGGVGKTTSTVNVAAGLSQLGQRVLVIDLDPQGNASTALGVDHHRGVPSTYDMLVEGQPLADVMTECADLPGLWVVPATIDLAGAEIELVSVVAREQRLARAINAHPLVGTAEEVGDDRFDYVLVDCPPSLGLLTLNALVAGREMFIPIQAEYYALEGLGQLLETVEMVRQHLNPRLVVSTILLTMYDARTRLAAGVADEVRSHFGDQVLKTAVPRSVRVSEAPSYGQTVMTYDPASAGALSYLEAAREIASKGAPHEHPSLPARSRHAEDPHERQPAPPRPRARPRVADPDGPEPARAERAGRHRAARPHRGRATRQRRRTARPPALRRTPTVAGAYFAELPITQVRPNARQPRQVFEEEALAELVHSIREVGLLQPVVVRRTGEDAYELIMGERRWRASQEAGRDTIPAIVRETDDNDMLRDALLENLHRSQLNPLEEAAAYGQLLEDFGCTHEELAQRIGRSRPQISNTLRLLKLSPAVQRRVAAGVLSAGHARALLARRRRRPPGQARRAGHRRGHLGAWPRGDRLRSASSPTRPPGWSATSRWRPGSPSSPTGCPTASRRGSRSTSARPRARSPSSSPASTTCAGSST